MTRNIQAAPFVKTIIARSVPFTAVASAGTINVFLMRQKELSDGIKVEDSNGTCLGYSSKAGLKAITQVIIFNL